MKILVAGDIHADWGKLNTLINDKRPDIILQCGDFGWWPKMEVRSPNKYKNEKKWLLHGIKLKGSKIYFCDGNHEDHESLIQNNKIQQMYNGVNFASRGSILTLPDKRNILFIGGADSIDKNLRTPGYDWFSQETINIIDLNRIMNHNIKIDIVISHTCPTTFFKHIAKSNFAKCNDPSCQALEYILEKYKPLQWFFGHWHVSKEGYDKGCHWEVLDCAGHRGKWWTCM